MKPTQQMTGASLWTSVITLEQQPMGKPEQGLNNNMVIISEAALWLVILNKLHFNNGASDFTVVLEGSALAL